MTYSYTNKDYIIFDFITFIHIFYKKKRFSKFKKLIKKQGLPCKNDLISIES